MNYPRCAKHGQVGHFDCYPKIVDECEICGSTEYADDGEMLHYDELCFK